MQSFLFDFRHALRMLRRAPLFSALVVATLALVIGANAAIFSVVNGVLLRALPYRDPQKLMLISDAENRENGGFLYKDIAAFRAQSHSFASLAAYYRDSGFSRVTLNSAGDAAGEPEQVQGAWVEAEMFPLLGV